MPFQGHSDRALLGVKYSRVQGLLGEVVVALEDHFSVWFAVACPRPADALPTLRRSLTDATPTPDTHQPMAFNASSMARWKVG